MKHVPTVILGLLCVGLAVSLFLGKRNTDAQHDKDAETITSVSNLLSSSQAEVAAFNAKVFTFSNQLGTCQSTSLRFSNELIEAKSALASTKEVLERQITDLDRQVTGQSTQLGTEKQASNQRIAELTHQVTELTNQIASARAGLLEANREYALLENRFRRDVAERVIAERRYNNRTLLKVQLAYLQLNPSKEISADRILEGFNVVVKSNLCYVIAPE